ncbi:MAG: type II secretion system GspH family protein [Hydrogenothermaceae bacterium]|nr:type II secretion system GspH family protein [Hydrogenothermaceae bacterium]
MREKVYISKCTSRRIRAFTLVEVLIVLTLLGLVFSLISFSFYNSINSSIYISQKAVEVENFAKFYWDFQRRFSTSNWIFIKKIGSNNYIITLYNTSGEFSKGLVKSVYFVKDGYLWYYEFPYVFGDPLFYEENKSIELLPLKSLQIEVISQDKKLDEFNGKSENIRMNVNLNGTELSF